MNMARKGRQHDDPAWDDHKSSDPKMVTVLREHFWRAMDRVPLSVPRWDSQPRMNANLRWLLDGKRAPDGRWERAQVPENIIRASFEYFRNEVESLDLSPQRSCWAVYFSRRERYLDQARAGQAGSRDDVIVHKVGDIETHRPVHKRRRIVRRPTDD